MALLVAAPALASDDDLIDPDRPDVTFSPNPVGKGRVQVETGMFYRRTSQAGAAAERRISAEATRRVGVTENLELRLDGEPESSERSPGAGACRGVALSSHRGPVDRLCRHRIPLAR
jgi:hypothetical protein